MHWWSGLSNFWQGFICGGVAIPLVIVIIEIIVKFWLRRSLCPQIMVRSFYALNQLEFGQELLHPGCKKRSLQNCGDRSPQK